MAAEQKRSPNPLNSDQYDQPPYDGERDFFIICSTPRTGSTLLCSLLIQTGAMGVPHEYFHQHNNAPALLQRFGIASNEDDRLSPQNLSEYIKEILRLRTTPNGVFGLKLHFRQMVPLLQSGAFWRNFPNAHYIWMRRRDLIAQSVSLTLAIQTSRFHSFQEEMSEPRYDAAEINRHMSFILSSDAGWRQFFAINEIAPLELWYEDLDAKPGAVFSQVCDFVGYSQKAIPMVAETGLQRLGTDMNRDWARRFRTDPINAGMRGPDIP